MAVKITETALREFVRNMLLEEAGDDAPAEETNPPAVSEIPMDKPDTPLEADPRVIDNELGPPTADPSYIPDGMPELKAAVGKLLDDVPDSAIGTAYKIVRKSLDNLHSVLRQRSEISPGVEVVIPGSFEPGDPISTEEPTDILDLSESTSLERLVYFISEATYEPGRVSMDSSLVKGASDPTDPFANVEFGEEEDEEFEEEEIEVSPAAPGARRVVDAPKGGVTAAGFGTDDVQPDTDLEKMIGSQMSSAQAEKMRKDKESAEKAQAVIDKEQGVVSQMLVDKSLAKRIEIAKEMFASKASAIDAALEKGDDLDAVLNFDELERVQEELEATDAFTQSMQAGSSKFSEMSDELKSRYADVFLGGGEPMKSSVFRNIQDSAFMKFMMGLAIGPDIFDEKFVEFIISPPEDAKKIRSFLIKNTDVARIMSNPTAGGVEKVLDQLREKSAAGDLVDQYRHLVTLYLANDIDFPGAKSSKFHFNKKVGNDALEKAVSGLIRRGEKESYNNLKQLLNDPKNKKTVTGHLGKDWKIESWKSKEAEEEVPDLEPQPEPKSDASIKRSPGGRTFRRRTETEMSESMTPADAILQSAPVNPDLDKALLLVKGIA
jgi:hypothetical protein